MKTKIILALLFLILVSVNANAALLTNLSSYYTFDATNVSGATLVDSVGNNNASCGNMASNCNTGVGKIIDASSFDGSNDYVKTNLRVNATMNFTVSMWLNWTTISNGVRFISDENVSAGFYAYTDTTGRIVLETRNASARSTLNSSTNVSINKWYHIVLSRNEQTTQNKIYINGTNVATLAVPNSNFLASPSILSLMNGSGTWTTGKMDEFGFWNKELDASEVLALYNNGNGSSYPFTGEATANFTITATSNWTGFSLTTFNASITNSTITTNYTTIGSQINTTFPSNYTELVNITITAPDRFPLVFTNYNVSSNLIASMIQTEIKFALRNEITGASIVGNSTISAVTKNNNTAFFLDNGTYSVVSQSAGYFSNTSSLTFAALENATYTINMSDANATFIFNNYVYYNGSYVIRLNYEGNSFTTNQSIGTTNKTFLISSGNYSATIWHNSDLIVNYSVSIPSGNSVVNLTSFGINNATFRSAETGLALSNSNVTVLYPNGDSLTVTTNANGTAQFFSASSTLIQNGTYSFTFPGTTGYQTPITFNQTFTLTALPFNVTFNISQTNINIRLYDRETGALINYSVTVTISGYASVTTNNGTITIRNASIVAGTYTAYTNSSAYSPAQKTFTYTSQANVTLDLYLFNASSSNIGNLIVIAQDSFYNTLIGVDTRLQEFDIANNNWIEVSQCISDSNGECKFSVQLNSKYYRVIASATINGRTLTGISSNTGALVTVTDSIINVYLNTVPGFTVDELFNLNITITNTSLVGNISYLTATFYDASGLSHEVCIEYFYMNGFVETSLAAANCLTGSSGTINAGGGFELNLNYTNIAKVYVINDDGTIQYYGTYRYQGTGSFQTVFGDFVKPFMLFLMILLLGLALHLKNIYIFGAGTALLTWVYTVLTPSYLSVGISCFITIFAIIIMWLGRKKESGYGT